MNKQYDDLLKSQAYLISHQQDLLDTAIKRNSSLIGALNECHIENQKLRLRLKGHEDGRLWTFIIGQFFPVRDGHKPK